MATQVVRVSFAEDLLSRLAQDLLTGLTESASGDLSSGLVLLPSSRACQTLGHRLLETSVRDALLLPRIYTASQWEALLATGLGLTDQGLPDDRFRTLALAHELVKVSWLSGRSESAPGLAQEFLAFFDEVRLHGKQEVLLDAADSASAIHWTDPGEAEALGLDLARAQEVWRLYRQAVPRDRTDHLVGLAAAVEISAALSFLQPELVMVAGFGRIDPARARLLRAALGSSEAARLYLPAADSPLSRLFLATWGAGENPTHPLAPARHVAAALLDEPGQEDSAAESKPLRQRLVSLDPPDALLAPSGPLDLQPCIDPEGQARLITQRVVEMLQGNDGASSRIAIATPNPRLARRICGHLRNAGIDFDETHGQPLAAQPAGLLLRFILRAALTGLRAEALLEVLTHPYVELSLKRGSHAVGTLRLEGMFRSHDGPQSGLGGLLLKAQDRDDASHRLFNQQGEWMVEFVGAIAEAFAPLANLGHDRRLSWRELAAALHETWQALAAGTPLTRQSDRPDVAGSARLLATLQHDSGHLPAVKLSEFTVDLGRLLADEDVAPRRARQLPVLVTGMLEARLERFDLLILAGMQHGVFPPKVWRPVLLGGRVRQEMGLPHWGEELGHDAELFLRLLHNHHAGGRVVLTWSEEEEGQPVLPSPFVSRLHLVLGRQDQKAAADATIWSRETPAWEALAAGQTAFAAEGLESPAHVPLRPRRQFSWSSLQVWRDCPYRFLLAKGLALRQEEEIVQEFGKMDYGQLVHAAMRDFLDPDGPGSSALAQGQADRSASLLEGTAAEHFLPGSAELPVRKLWLESFRQSIPGIVQLELERIARWRPTLLEKDFSLTLGQLTTWLRTEAEHLDDVIELPEWPDEAADILLTGKIDRVDARSDGRPELTVIDYKTGKAPTNKRVQELHDLQLILYAAALEAGGITDPLPQGTTVATGFYYVINGPEVGMPTRKPPLTPDAAGRRLLIEGAARLMDLACQASDPQAVFALIPDERANESKDGLPCRYCDMRGICRLEERDLPPVTTQRLNQLVNRKEWGVT